MIKDWRAELVRIDAQGQAHPIGAVASQRLRARSGAFRLLPAPAHVILMRYTGEDGRRDAGDGAIVRLAGEITSAGAVCDIIAMLGQTGWKGELVVLDAETSRSIFFEGGYVVGVQTNVADERLGMVLYRYGAITWDQHELVLSKTKDGHRFASAAVELGLLGAEHAYSYLTRQIEEVTFATFSVADGTFFFLEGFDDTRLPSRQRMSANALLMDGVTRMDELRYFRQKIPASDYVPVRQEGRTPPAPDYEWAYAAIDGKSSIEEIGRATGRGEFDTTKAVYALVQTQHVTIQPPRLSGGPAAIVQTANLALREILDAATREQRVDAVRESLASFAVGAGVFDILFRGAGPDARGELDAHRVADNAVMVTSGSDPEQELAQMMYEYVSFALFSAGGVLPAAAEEELRRLVAPIMGRLRP